MAVTHRQECQSRIGMETSTESERGKMSMDYIRRTYDVPAKRGARILFCDTGGLIHDGVIVGSRDAYLRVRLPTFSGRNIVTLHPTSDLLYPIDGQKGRK